MLGGTTGAGPLVPRLGRGALRFLGRRNIMATAVDAYEGDVQSSGVSALDAMRHSLAHIMAEAVLKLFPAAKLGIGPWIENGFYYDFDLPRPLTPEDLGAIERLMRERIADVSPFERLPITHEHALERF